MAQPDREEAYRQALLKAKDAIRQLMEENAALRKKETIAIIGMSCRFPGGANDPADFWRHLQEGVDAITDVPESRWPAADYLSADPDAPGKMYTARGGFLNVPVGDFDAPFFGITPREARAMDPQHRLLLETGWEALEDAFLDPSTLKHSRTGVYIGMAGDDYVRAHRHSGQPDLIDAYSITGSTGSTAAGRLSYLLGLHGPSLAIDTACSSALVALHLACRGLRSGETDMAMVGGVNLILSPEGHICFSKLRAISPEGRCKAFDATADGYVRSEGAGFVILKRMADAVRDGNRILAEIKGTAVNQDGRTNGLAAPNGEAQKAVLREALGDAGLDPADIDYVEAHGTGTLLGDPIEAEALGSVFGPGRRQPLSIGSVKSNIGHLEAAAGMAGLIKLILALRHEQLPASLHFRTPNPHVDWTALSLRVNDRSMPWKRSERPRRAGLSSFGFSGTNAHVILGEAPPTAPRGGEPVTGSHLLCLSAHDQAGLRDLAVRYRSLLSDAKPGIVADICHSAAISRRHLPCRLAVEGTGAEEMRDRLDAYLAGQPDIGVMADSADNRKTAFLFTGQGSQYPCMGHGLYQAWPVFREAVDRCDALLRPRLGFSLAERMFTDTAEALAQTALAQPALFVLEYALSRLWASWGIHPQFVIGHSVGEYVAACIAGVFSLEDGLTLIAERGRLMQALPPGGAMAALFAAPDRVALAVAADAGPLDIAAINGPDHTVISGDAAAVERVADAMEAQGVRVAHLAVSHAFHSALMEPMLAAFEQTLSRITLYPPRIPVVSNLTGEIAGPAIATPRYWIDHIRRPVAFAAGMAALARAGARQFLELGPQATLLAMGRQCVAGQAGWLPSLKRGAPDAQVIQRSLGALYAAGATVDWAAFHAGRDHRWIDLPHYPFQRSRHWIDAPPAKAAPEPARIAPLLDRMVRSPLLDTVLFETRFGVDLIPLLAEHRIFGTVVVSGASLVSMVLQAATQAFGDVPVSLSDLLMRQALVIPDDGYRLVHLAFTPASGPEIAFRLISLDATQDPDSQILHLSGTLRTGAVDATPPLSPAGVLDMQGRLDTRLSGEQVRQAHRHRHIDLGPSYVWLESMRLDPHQSVGHLRPPPLDRPLTTQDHRMHPGLVDSWISLLAAMVGIEGDKPLVPFAMDRFTLFRPPGDGPLLAHARRRPAEGRMIGDLWLWDQAGNLVAECLGLEGRQTTMEALMRRPAADPAQSWFHQLQWLPSELPVAADPDQAPWLIFADAAGEGDALARHLAAGGRRTVRVTPGMAFSAMAADQYQIDPQRADDMALLLETALAQRGQPFHVAYLWGLDARSDGAASLADTIAGATLPFLHLLGAIARRNDTISPTITVVTRGAGAVSADQPVEPAQAPLCGLALTAALEHPELRVRLVDLDPGADAPSTGALARALTGTDDEERVALRQGRRHVARLVRVPPPAPPEPVRLRADKSYLIVGGLGGLGRLTARRLVARGARDLTLTGRSGAGPEAEAFLTALRQEGATVRICRADLAVVTDVAAALATATAERPLAGIIHAAGILDDGVLPQLDGQRLSRALAAKTVGLYHLHEQTRHLPLDFFVGYSSMVSMTGSPAQGAYAAANGFVDALMQMRRAGGLTGLSINWGPWAEAGMAARLEERQGQRLSRQGLTALPPEDALDALERAMAGAVSPIGIMQVDWSAFLRHMPGTRYRPLFETLLPKSQERPAKADWMARLRDVPPASRRPTLTGLVREEIIRVMGAPAGTFISPRQPLFELGMDSLMAVELRGRLSGALGCALATTLLFDHPTLEALTDHLAATVPGLEPASPPAAPPAAAQPVADAGDLDDLSMSELEALLAERLALGTE